MKKFANEPKQLISVAFAKKLNKNYLKSRTALIAKELKIEDANAIWFSLEELENYIKYIKTEGKKQSYTIDGIRFYFGVYPDDKKYEEKAGLTTLFLSPTGKKEEEKTQSISKIAAQNQSDISSISPMNYGEIGRPPAVSYLL